MTKKIPPLINIASYLIVVIAAIDIVLQIYNHIHLQPIYNQIFNILAQTAQNSALSNFATILFAAAILNFVLILFFAVIMFFGLRKAKRSIYILTLISTIIAFFPTAFSALGFGASKGFYETLLASAKPEVVAQIIQGIEATQSLNILLSSIEFFLLMVLLILLLMPQSRAWFQKLHLPPS